MKKLAIVGCGKLAHLVVEALLKGLLADYSLVGAQSRTADKTQRLCDKAREGGHECTPCSTMDELLALKPDYIVETASPEAMRALALPALRQGISLVTLSIGALADTDFYQQVERTARDNNARVHLASGAIGGFDVMRTASLMGQCKTSFRTEKSPRPLRRTAVYTDDLEHSTRQVFSGNAKEAIALFPTQVNVSVAAALATVGPDNIDVAITSIPDYVGDDHRIEVENDQVHAIIDVYSKTADIAGWSVVNTLRNITSAIVF
ncbi:DUF108 domain-containing protein [Gilvimarinus agarilyticus]|uniref:aspartate dehydrogenase domain-containing protein n=1 Tax=unclassified Gilvimarinus TaxID=2642066 RepID=UPI001C09AB24|nr:MULTISPECIES: aspartate dehydrogenase domain-containing protein [unclassified Gilvimarinus]MBU2887816.1 DUF108 domain-containing protein [Gilvimarinus agarilyticus]MDO6572454.1 DUF108 domain-containing protein [Gilvimarinus sp. 2_MG-2023]MDO6746598.1 DUF108 domain-containing protein [Gilvimarinus sp. 1_MG-2023]